MTEYIVANGTYVFRRHVSAAMDEGVSTRSFRKVDRSTRTTAEGDHLLEVLQSVLLRITGSKDDVDDVFLDLLIEVHLFDDLTRLDDIIGREDRQHGLLLRCDVLTDDGLLLFFLRITNHDLEHETVGLRLGQRISTFLLDRVLGSEYEERVIEFEGLLTDATKTGIVSNSHKSSILAKRNISVTNCT